MHPYPNSFNTSARWLKVSIKEQCLYLLNAAQEILASWPVSTAKNGTGEQENSGCTPRGWHKIKLKIGEGADKQAVFVGRRPTGEIYTPQLAVLYPNRDWILGRILWLTGLEQGKNRGGQQDTLRRFIYFHATPDTEPMGVPLSHGCIRLHPNTMLEVFAAVEVGTRVFIEDLS